jgi:hypothetical protein
MPRMGAAFLRADTRGGLSKGLGAFRIGRPLVSDNGGQIKTFRSGGKFSQFLMLDFGRRGRRGCGAIAASFRRTQQHHKQQSPRQQGLERMFDNTRGDMHGASP